MRGQRGRESRSQGYASMRTPGLSTRDALRLHALCWFKASLLVILLGPPGGAGSSLRCSGPAKVDDGWPGSRAGNISRRRDMLNAASTWASTSNLALQKGPQHSRPPTARADAPRSRGRGSSPGAAPSTRGRGPPSGTRTSTPPETESIGGTSARGVNVGPTSSWLSRAASGLFQARCTVDAASEEST